MGGPLTELKGAVARIIQQSSKRERVGRMRDTTEVPRVQAAFSHRSTLSGVWFWLQDYLDGAARGQQTSLITFTR